MAKKGKSKGKGNQAFSEDKHIKESARNLEIGKCYVTPGWQESGMAMVVVTRRHKQGGITAGVYLIDTFCLGLKDTYYFFNITEREFEQSMELFGMADGTEDATYAEAHNIIYSAIEFAREGGIKPHKDWAVTKYILEEDDDRVPMIEYEMGRDGKHFLMARDRQELSTYLPTLLEHLGEDGVDYLVDDDYLDDYGEDDDYDDEISDKELAEMLSKTSNGENAKNEEYTHKTTIVAGKPQPPQKDIDRFLRSTHSARKEARRVLAMPHDGLKQYLEQTLLYSMTGECRENTFMGDPTVANTVTYLGEVGDEHSLDILLETLRQDIDYFSLYFHDLSEFFYIRTLAKLAHGHIDRLEALICEPGIAPIGRHLAMSALTQIYYTHPETQTAIKELWRRVMDFYATALPACHGCDSFTAAFAVCALTDLRAKDMLPQIKKLMDENPVPTFVCGTYDDVVKSMDDEEMEYDPEKYPSDIYEFYDMIVKDIWQD